jgi:hypothetical protein
MKKSLFLLVAVLFLTPAIALAAPADFSGIWQVEGTSSFVSLHTNGALVVGFTCCVPPSEESYWFATVSGENSAQLYQASDVAAISALMTLLSPTRFSLFIRSAEALPDGYLNYQPGSVLYLDRIFP